MDSPGGNVPLTVMKWFTEKILPRFIGSLFVNAKKAGIVSIPPDTGLRGALRSLLGADPVEFSGRREHIPDADVDHTQDDAEGDPLHEASQLSAQNRTPNRTETCT